MRERIAGAFVALAIGLIVLVVTIRAFALSGLAADQEALHLRDQASVVGTVVADRVELGEPVDRALLRELAGVDERLVYTGSDGDELVAEGPAYDTSDGVVEVSADAGEGSVVLTTGARPLLDVSAREVSSLLMLALLVAILAGLAGWWLASRLAAPFAALGTAAAALGRGRFDLDVPSTRIPEARKIGQALRVSAAQLEGRLAREREFAEFASHELRTPLTALQLELEDLTLRDDVPDDAQAAARRCMQRVDDVNAAAGHLVSISRQGALMEGAEVPLADLATHVTQAWADRLDPDRRQVSARADGELDLDYTPGPVEQVLELVLDDVVGGDGPVRLRFVGSDHYVRVEVPAGIAGPPPHLGVSAARDLAEAQGGRVTGDLVDAGLDVLMPRR